MKIANQNLALETHFRTRFEDGAQPCDQGGPFGAVGWWKEGSVGEGEEEESYSQWAEEISGVEGCFLYPFVRFLLGFFLSR
jgi:hypothetical protein